MIWDICLLLSAFWVCLRLYQLSKIPRELLEESLCYDIPPVPEISIAGVQTRSILLYWLNAEDSGFVGATLSVLCNGIKLGNFKKGETSVEISHLKPGCCYNVKFLSTNSANIATMSATARVQTLPERYPTMPADVGDDNGPAQIQTASSPFCSHPAQPSPKDGATPQHNTTKGVTARRAISPLRGTFSLPHGSGPATDSDEDDSLEYIECLTHRLELLKRQKEDLDRQIEDEEAEAKASQGDLQRERDHLRLELKDKEDSSAELRKQGNQLDKLNRSAQSKRSAKEKLLHQKKAERQRLKNDVQRWDLEVIAMTKHIGAMMKELASLNADKEGEVADLRQALSVDQNAIKAVEDDIRVKGAQIKDLEQRKDNEEEEADNGNREESSKKVKDEIWESNFQALQIRLQSMWNALQQSKIEEQRADDHLAWWQARRARNPEDFFGPSFMDNLPSLHGARSKRTGQHHARSITHPTQGRFGGGSSGFSMPTDFNTSRAAYQAGGTLPFTQTVDHTNLSQAVVASGPQGAMMSPAANDLLPSYLLRDEDTSYRTEAVGESELGSSSHFFRHAMSNSDASALGPHTPISACSRAGSVFTSPHDSMHNVSAFGPESDRHVGNPNSTPLSSDIAADATSPPSGKFAHIFFPPFGRQRGKSNAQEPPALGTLKQGQSQSFPRNMEQEPMHSSSLRRRRGSHGTWANPVAGLIGRNGIEPHANIIRARTGSGRSSRLNVFKQRMNNFDVSDYGDQEQATSRPSSTYSYDLPFSRPSSESQNIWSSVGDTLPNRNSSLNATWSAPPGLWSRRPSRRASVQHGSSTNLSIGSTPLDADDINQLLSNHKPEQAPIGTRPTVRLSIPPKLNPAAPSFKTLFSRGEAKRAAKAEKAYSKQAKVLKSKESDRDTVGNEHVDAAFPTNSRLSKDAQSITTAASTAGSHDSFERSISGTPLESPIPKETLMQKITRKSSSSKFFSKERGIFSKRVGEPYTSGEVDEDTSSEGHLGAAVESTTPTPREEKSGRAWPSIRRKSKKGAEAIEKGSDMGEEDE